MNLDITQIERPFEQRHIGPSATEVNEMLAAIGVNTVDELMEQTVPATIRSKSKLNLPAPKSESEFLASFDKMMSKNKVFKSHIGMGYYGCITPKVIHRNILENPGWYTAYTPYQAEIAQGRLEALINFQTMVADLTGLPVANASLLDEGTAAAEAMAMFYNKRKGVRKNADSFFVDENIFPQTLDILKTRALPIGIKLIVGDLKMLDVNNEELFGMLIQYPNNDGAVIDHSALIGSAGEVGIKTVVVADILSLCILKAPGEMGADAVVGTTQRLGIPMGFGGPHAAYFATKEEYKRLIPGRIIGLSKDRYGKPAYRMALQTREQHIRREKATSNICTAQVLLAVMAGMYAVYHGPDGMRNIARRINALTAKLSIQLKKMGYIQTNEFFFDTLKVIVDDADHLMTAAQKKKINFRYFENGAVGISLDETTSVADVEQILNLFAKHKGEDVIDLSWEHDSTNNLAIPLSLKRDTPYLQHEVFSKYHTEHEMLRYLKRLENKDLSLVHSMISLGSCTMKLNATAEMIPLSWPTVGQLHPFVPKEQCEGYYEMFDEMSEWLADITGFHGVSLQPNSGAQGEYAGLMVIRAYHESRGEQHRNITLIPASAHGTNPASAVMAGQKVVIVKCDDRGNIDVVDLVEKAENYSDNLAALMITYPSTHGVFEEDILEVCRIIHDHGGQVYMDGANMNAQVGLTSPGAIGADVCHLNLHKTFCIPHGGGGPGMGPICVAKHLTPFLPGSPTVIIGGPKSITAISAAPFGSASILTISYAYMAMMGGEGLTNATKIAILNANYIKDRLATGYKVLYIGANGRCAHEMIIDCRMFKKIGVQVVDIAKRLMDYGFHAPTVSFPVAGTLMIEPTESETKEEMDRFCAAMLAIRAEIKEVELVNVDPNDNVVVNSPHTLDTITSDEWEMPYTRKEAAFPVDFVRANKFWPSVSRIDDAYGDRNLMCTCAPIESFEIAEA